MSPGVESGEHPDPVLTEPLISALLQAILPGVPDHPPGIVGQDSEAMKDHRLAGNSIPERGKHPQDAFVNCRLLGAISEDGGEEAARLLGAFSTNRLDRGEALESGASPFRLELG
ncbi:MAG TPA: hypothetical protein EYN79_08225, partial [Planctomycetes bacterium]|nr:hypothetical protein [Planctomycetota bacterium]